MATGVKSSRVCRPFLVGRFGPGWGRKPSFHGPCRSHASPLVHLGGVGSMALEMELSGLVEWAQRTFVSAFWTGQATATSSAALLVQTPQARAGLIVSALRLLGVSEASGAWPS